jgi:hypothetical protein
LAGYPSVVAAAHYGGGGDPQDPILAANGSYNSVYDYFAANVMGPCASTIYAIRISWEWYGNWFKWAAYYRVGNYSHSVVDAATWKAGFQNMVNEIRKNPKTAHIKIEWDFPLNSNWGWQNAIGYYPGDAYVDIIGADLYFQSQYGYTWDFYNAPAGTTTYGSINDWAAFANAHGKPMGLGEWCDAYMNDGGTYLTNMSNFIKSHNFVYQTYWDTDFGISPSSNQHCFMQVNTSAQAAYTAAWKNWQASGNFWGGLIVIPNPLPGGLFAGF